VSRLLVIGMGPLFDDEVRHFGGQGLRTWYFVGPLLADGHTVRLVTLPIHNPPDPASHRAVLVQRAYAGFEYEAFSVADFGFMHENLTQIARSFKPDAMLGVNMVAAWAAARLPVHAPLWADLNGYEMAEKQGQAARTGNDEPLMGAWRMESTVARRADKFSTVSRPQLHALLGEMACVGRLNQYTFDYHFVHHIPNAYHAAFASAPDKTAKPALRGEIVPATAFVLLWSGSYNYWTDPSFLFEFVEAALAADDRIHYVSTGGGVEGYNSRTYEEFVKRVNSSPHRARYHLLGWVPAQDLPAIYHESDLGLNIDEVNYETFFGARNRLNNLMAAGVPVLTTYGSEISQTIEDAGCGIVCPSGDVGALTDAVLRLARSPEERRRLSERARRFALQEFAPEKITRAAREWAAEPSLAPDNAEKLRRRPGLASFLDVPVNYLEEMAKVAQDHDLLVLRQAHHDLAAIRSKWWYRILKGFGD